MVNKSLIFGAFLGLMLFVSLFGNIVAHEFGHWAVAEHYSLNPQMHFGESLDGEKANMFTASFFTTYNAPVCTDQDFWVTLAGPLTNVLIAAGLLLAYKLTPKKTYRINMLFLVLIIPAILSAIVNFMPLQASDGQLIFSYLR
jgi:Zn-dependent protease